MFIHWRRQPLADVWVQEPGDADFAIVERVQLAAQLRRSVRADGKPRSLVVGTLGHIEERWIARPAERMAFWQTALRRLEELQVSDDDRARMVAGMAERVEPFDDCSYFASWPELSRLWLVDPDIAAAVVARLGDELDAEARTGWAALATFRQEALQRHRPQQERARQAAVSSALRHMRDALLHEAGNAEELRRLTVACSRHL